MLITVTQINNKEAALINPVIPNKDGSLHVAIRSINYVVGYQNIKNFSFNVFIGPDGRVTNFVIPPGLYTIKRLVRTINSIFPQTEIKLSLSEETGIVTFTSEDTRISVVLSGGLHKILGFDNKKLSVTYVGDRPAYLPTDTLFYIYLDQLSTSSNLVDGAPSSLLAIVPATADGDSVVRINPSNPMYKRLQVGNIHQLSLRVLNERGEIFDNNKKPMTAVLEIRHVYYTDSASR